MQNTLYIKHMKTYSKTEYMFIYTTSSSKNMSCVNWPTGACQLLNTNSTGRGGGVLITGDLWQGWTTYDNNSSRYASDWWLKLCLGNRDSIQYNDIRSLFYQYNLTFIMEAHWLVREFLHIESTSMLNDVYIVHSFFVNTVVKIQN